MTFTREERGARIKSCLRATLSIINPTWTGLGSQPGFRSHSPATSSLSHGATLFTAVNTILVVKCVCQCFGDNANLESPHNFPLIFFKFLFYT